ncbi:Gli, partial [Cordylochernes scorpioides]
MALQEPQVAAWKLANQQDYQLACPQHYQYYGQELGVRDISEDCLYLNVFTPYARPMAREKFAVMVYIHGGFWDHGSANTFPPHMLVASQQVVVVTFNFRLGPLGFLATGDGAAPGNYGLLDQRMAIQWVYDNIEAFNGDRERITLFGPGSGAASAGLHMLSPSSARMVRRVIAQSGSAVADWAVATRPSIVNSSAAALARQVGCHDIRDSWRMVECLRRVPFTDMIGLTMRPEAGWTMWSPVVDRHTRDQNFLPYSPQELLQSSSTVFRPDIAYMAGVTRNEGSAFLKEEIKEPNHEVTPEILHRRIWDYIRMYNFTLDRAALIKAIEFMYWPASDRKNHTLLRQAYIDLLSDSYINAPNDKMAKLLMQRSVRTYLYVLNYTLEGLPQRDTWEGVPHNHEYFMVTGAPFMDHSIYPPYMNLANARWTESDRNMSQLLMTLWANFAKHGDPTPVLLNDHVLWRESSLESMRFLMLNNTNYTTRMVDGGFRQKESQFWSEYLPSSVLSTDSPPIWGQPEWQQDRQRYQVALSCVAGLAALCFVLMVLCCCLYCRSR